MISKVRGALGVAVLSGFAAVSSGCSSDRSASSGGGQGGHAGTSAAGGVTGTAGIAGPGGGGSGVAGAGAGGSGNEGGASAPGNGGSAAGGRAGTEGGGAAGGAAAGGTAGTGMVGGVLLACPPAQPAGACTIDGQSCAYPTGSCLCVAGAWSCIACPAARPESGASASAGDGRLFFSCTYGAVTCSAPSHFGNYLASNYGYDSSTWACGVCPANRPTDGATCGNTDFECRYGDDTCQCSKSSWSCVTPTCEIDPAPNLSAKECNGTIGHYSCRYPSSDQTCVCGGARERRCSCPAAPLANGTSCVGFVYGSCTYGDLVCTCFGSAPSASRWNCTVPPPPVCPTTRPTGGTACSMQVDSCAYGTEFCSCDGAKWTCV